MAVKCTGHLSSILRVPLESYLREQSPKVYSLVAGFSFSPVDIDIGLLARGEWNPLYDRFRVWYLPGDEAESGRPLCYVMIRKFDPGDMVMVYAHVVVNVGAKVGDTDYRTFTVGIMSNDDVRARTTLNSMLEIPPSFHRRSEVQLVEKRWRDDSDAVMRFMANIHSAMTSPAGEGKTYTLKIEPPPGMMRDLKKNLGTWWDGKDSGQ